MRYIFLFLFFSLHHDSSAQRKVKDEKYYVFNNNWEPCDLDTATYMAYVQKFADTIWQWNYYHLWGRLINVETFKDEKATMPNGYFAYYNKAGKIDSCGQVINGFRDGTWYLYGDSIKPQVKKEYAGGRLISEKSISSIAEDPSTGNGSEASFKGGAKGWVNYLQKNFQFPKRAESKNISGTAIVGFVVSEAGKIENSFIIRSVEFSIDKEALRLLDHSPNWIPGERDGQKVKAYRIQPITFAY
jgi:periplasmic protein TonB